MVPLLANLALAVVSGCALLVAHRGTLLAGAIAWTLGVAGLYLGVTVAGWDRFARLQVLSWAIFLYAPVVLAVSARRRPALGVLAATLVLIGIDAFFIEPRWLEVTTTALPGPPLRIALVADLQTDQIGDHERAALDAVRAAKPDLVLFAGDYVQIRKDDDSYTREAAAFTALVRDLPTRLGAFAVRGDVDRDEWPDLFAGTGVTAVENSTTFDLGNLTLTALAPADAASLRPPVPARDGFHIVLAHRPDFALTRPDADLLLAGHVHGGQVRLPFIGPLITLSNVPRDWAVGLTTLPWGGHLFVSRGVGMERKNAPRLRFLCRPEIAILELG